MERYLDRCLSSLVVHDYEEWECHLEVLVILDGSTDGSIDIARRYEAEYGDVFRVIEKENGNYGSCINRGLKEARGTYVKILDADDWFNTKVFQQFLTAISAFLLEANHPDVIQTPFTCIGCNGQKEVVRYNTMGREPYTYGKIYSLDDVLKDGYIRFFLMHGLAYRTELLRQMAYIQTEGMSYTDSEWSCYPFYAAQTIVFLDYNLYQYDIARDGQTMSWEVLFRSLDQLMTVVDNMVSYYERHITNSSVSETRRAWMKAYLSGRIRVIYRHFLLDMPRSQFDNAEMQRVDEHYSELCQRNGFSFVLYPENKILRIDYINYWHKHHHRWPLLLECCNKILDAIARWFYIRIVRRK